MDPAILESTVRAVLETLDGFAQRYVTNKAAEVTDNPDTAAAFGKAAAMNPEAKSLMVKTAPAILAKHGWADQATPELAFLAGAGMYATALFTTVARLEKLAKEKQQPKPQPEKPHDQKNSTAAV